MPNKDLYQKITKEVGKLELSYYPTLLLTNIVYSKVRHPLEKTDTIIGKVTEKIIPAEYKKHKKGKNFIRISVNKELQALESALHECTRLPEELAQGDIVKNAIKYLITKTMED